MRNITENMIRMACFRGRRVAILVPRDIPSERQVARYASRAAGGVAKVSRTVTRTMCAYGDEGECGVITAADSQTRNLVQ